MATPKIVEIYPLSNYRLGNKEPKREKDFTLAQRNAHMEWNAYTRKKAPEELSKVHRHNRPHALIFRVRDRFWRLPGGKLRRGETEIEGLKRKLSSKLAPSFLSRPPDWKIGECVATWWRGEFATYMCSSYPEDLPTPKECKKLFLIHLSEKERFMVPKNWKLRAVPLYDLYNNAETYGMVISRIAHQLFRSQIKIMNPPIDKGSTCT